jgi:hypothetical protein
MLECQFLFLTRKQCEGLKGQDNVKLKTVAFECICDQSMMPSGVNFS